LGGGAGGGGGGSFNILFYPLISKLLILATLSAI